MLHSTGICKCSCHIQGRSIMHCFPCCDHCGEKYLNDDGSLKYNPNDKPKFEFKEKKDEQKSDKK